MDGERYSGRQEGSGDGLLMNKAATFGLNREINRRILKLSIPAIVSNITVPLLGLCDTAISGHLGSEMFLAAIGVGSVMLNVVFWLFGFLRMGTTGLTATALGQGAQYEIRKVFSRAMSIGLLAGILLIIFNEPVYQLLSRLVSGDDSIESSVREYFMIRVWGAPALLCSMAVSGWFVGMQSTLYPMIIAISMNILNILLSCLFVFASDMGFAGVAYGTMISNWIGLIIGIGCCMIYIKGGKLFCNIRDLWGRSLGKFFAVNVNLFFRSGCIIAVTLGMTYGGAQLGTMTLAVNVIIMQFFQFFSFFMDGFAFSGEALTGVFAGSSDLKKFRCSVKLLLTWTLGIGLIFSIIYLFFSSLFASLLTDVVSVVERVGALSWIVALIPICGCWAFIYDGFYIGVTSTRRMLESVLVASVLFFFIGFVNFSSGRVELTVAGNIRLWIAFITYLLSRGVYLSTFWKTTVSGLLYK